jgi:hypothetical protein
MEKMDKSTTAKQAWTRTSDTKSTTDTRLHFMYMMIGCNIYDGGRKTPLDTIKKRPTGSS